MLVIVFASTQVNTSNKPTPQLCNIMVHIDHRHSYSGAMRTLHPRKMLGTVDPSLPKQKAHPPAPASLPLQTASLLAVVRNRRRKKTQCVTIPETGLTQECWCLCHWVNTFSSLILRPLQSFLFVCFSVCIKYNIIMGKEEQQKAGKAWAHSSCKWVAWYPARRERLVHTDALPVN